MAATLRRCASKNCFAECHESLSYCKQCSWVDDEDDQQAIIITTKLQTLNVKQKETCNVVKVQPASHKCETCEQSCLGQYCSDCRAARNNKKPELSCYQRCKTCNITCRGSQCLKCKKDESKQNVCKTCNAPCVKLYCAECTSAFLKNAPTLTCGSCSTTIRIGRFCLACKMKYRSTFTDICKDCNENRIAPGKKYCASCVANFKTLRPCLTCGQETNLGSFCATCVAAYKENKIKNI